MGAILLHSATRYHPVKPCSQVLNLTAASHLSVIYNFASAVVAAEFNRRLQLRVSSDRLQIWSTDRSSQYVPSSEGLHVSRLVTVSPDLYVEALAYMCRGLCGNCSTVTVHEQPPPHDSDGCRGVGSSNIHKVK